jgi:hypothetical protein
VKKQPIAPESPPNRRVIVLAAAMCGVAVIYVAFFRKSDEDRIRAQLDALCEAVDLAEGENEIFRAARVERAFPKIFAPTVSLHVPELGDGARTRPDLVTLAVGAGHKASAIHLRFQGARVELDRREGGGWVTATASASVKTRDGESQAESRTVTIRFDKQDKEWLISEVDLPHSDR